MNLLLYMNIDEDLSIKINLKSINWDLLIKRQNFGYFSDIFMFIFLFFFVFFF